MTSALQTQALGETTPALPLAPHSVLLVYSSRFGQARKITQVIAQRLQQHGLDTHCMALPAGKSVAAIAGRWRAVLWIASVRYGHFDRRLGPLIHAQNAASPSTPWGFASVSLTARKPDKRTPHTHRNTQQFLARQQQRGLSPTWAAVFAGALRYPSYGWLDQQMIRLIMSLTGGVTDTRRDIEYTDWAAVHAWSDHIASTLTTQSTRP